MTAPAPRENPFLLGQDTAEGMLARAIGSGRMHHAWLITGPQGVGKATLAYRFARHLLAGGHGENGLAMETSHPTFRRVAANTHADLLTVEREWDEKKKKLRGEIVIDTVREVSGFLRLTPAEGGWRVVVVDGAEDINRNAANALLKVLEEPPPRAVLILVCSAAGRLLPTIRSRCRRLRLGKLDDPTMHSLMGRYVPEMPEDRRERLIWSPACSTRCRIRNFCSPTRWPMLWAAMRMPSAISWICCGRRFRPPCVIWLGASPIRIRHG